MRDEGDCWVGKLTKRQDRCTGALGKGDKCTEQFLIVTVAALAAVGDASRVDGQIQSGRWLDGSGSLIHGVEDTDGRGKGTTDTLKITS